MNSEFICGNEDFAVWPESILKDQELSFPGVHKDSKLMAVLAEKVREHNKDIFCMVPLCSTVEAEAVGAAIKLGDCQAGPRLEKYVLNDISELGKLGEIDLRNGRIKEVLDAVGLLYKKGQFVSLNVEGAFTIINYLIEPALLYKALKNGNGHLNMFLNRLEESLILYMKEGIKRGAKIISFADPNGNLDIVGPKIFTEMYRKFTLPLLMRFQRETKGAVMHLCGRMSYGLLKMGLAEAEAIEMQEILCYGEYIKKVAADLPDIKIIGNNCIKRGNRIEINCKVWKIAIK